MIYRMFSAALHDQCDMAGVVDVIADGMGVFKY